MDDVIIEVGHKLYARIERMARERGRSVEAEVETFFALLIQDPDYLDYMEQKFLRDIAGEEWKNPE